MAVMNPRASNPALPDFSKSSRDLEATAVGLTQNPVRGAEPSSHGPRQMIGALRGGVPFLAIFVMFGFVEPHHGARLAASHAHLVVSEFHGHLGNFRQRRGKFSARRSEPSESLGRIVLLGLAPRLICAGHD